MLHQLLLELSQFTKAKTKLEDDMGGAIHMAYTKLCKYSTGRSCCADEIHDAIAILRDAMTYLVNKDK